MHMDFVNIDNCPERRFVIRPMEAAEIPLCVQLIRDAFATVAVEFGITPENAPRFTAFATTEERLRWQLNQEKRTMHVAVDAEERIVGYCSVHRLQEGAWELCNLAVLPSWRHIGIGGLLVEDACRTVRNAGGSLVKIGIVEENRVLRKWYENAGFVHTGTEKFDFFPFTCGYLEKRI